MAVSKQLKYQLLKDVEADFSEQQSLKKAIFDDYQKDIEREVYQMAISEGFPSEMNIEDLNYDIEITPQESVEGVTERYLAFLEETSTDVEQDITNTNLRQNEFVDHAESYLNLNIMILESPSTFKEIHAMSSVNYLAQRMISFFDRDEYLRIITHEGEVLHESTHNQFLLDKVREAYRDEGLDFDETLKTRGFAYCKIHNLRPFTSFEDIAERFAERIETKYKTIQSYLESQYYNDLDATNEINFDVVVPHTNDDMVVYFAIEPEDLEPTEIKHVIQTEFNISTLKRNIARKYGYDSEEALQLATDPDREDLWITELEYPETFTTIQKVAEDALRENGIFTRRMFDETSDINFIYDALISEYCLIACDIGEEDNHAYCLTYDLNKEALDEFLNEY